MSCSRGWRSATEANAALWPGARNITGSPAFSASGQNQSAVPSLTQAAAGPRKVTRSPNENSPFIQRNGMSKDSALFGKVRQVHRCSSSLAQFGTNAVAQPIEPCRHDAGDGGVVLLQHHHVTVAAHAECGKPDERRL